MKRVLATAFALLVFVSSTARAVSLSGIVLYAADDFGNPNGRSTFDGELQAQLWRTGVGGIWHGLGVWQGAPPDCFRSQPLNASDMMIEVPLVDGENVLTLMGEEGALTRTDDYVRFTVNLYFDGAVNSAPGISVIFDKFATPIGGPVYANRASILLTLGLQQVDPNPQPTYDDGFNRVTVVGAAFLPPERFNPEFNFDFMKERQFGESGKKDYIGILKLLVEPSQQANVGSGGVGGGGGGGAAVGPGAGNWGGGGGVAPGYPVGGVPLGAAGGDYQGGAGGVPRAFPTPRGSGQVAAPRAVPTARATSPVEDEPTAEATVETPTALATADKTKTAATPDKTKTAATPDKTKTAAAPKGTPTAARGTPAVLRGTPTPGRLGTSTSRTLTPVRRGVIAATPTAKRPAVLHSASPKPTPKPQGRDD